MGFPKDDILCSLERLKAGIGTLEGFNEFYNYNLQGEEDVNNLYFFLLGEYRQWQVEQTCHLIA